MTTTPSTHPSAVGEHGVVCTTLGWAAAGACTCTRFADGTISSFDSPHAAAWICRGLTEREAAERDLRQRYERLAEAHMTASQRRATAARVLAAEAERLGRLFPVEEAA